jgi:hypothetical protein
VWPDQSVIMSVTVNNVAEQRKKRQRRAAQDEDDDEDESIFLEFMMSEIGRDPVISPAIVQHIVQSTRVATDQTSAALRSYVPAFKKDMSTSILSGNLWIHEALEHQNPRYMPELFGIDAAGFKKLVGDLGLEDGRSVSKEMQLAMFFQVVRSTQHLRNIGDRDQRAKDTISKYFKLVLAKLADREGFYAEQVTMPVDGCPRPAKIAEDPRFSGDFDGCIGAIDGTLLPILYVRLFGSL